MPRYILLSFCLILLLSCVSLACAQAPAYPEGQRMELPAADKSGGMPLMQALNQRHTNRQMSAQALSLEDLSNLLWATWGVNRADGRHTAPTAQNHQRVAVLVALESGVWFYDSARHQLLQVMARDIRSQLNDAPQALIYAAPAGEVRSALHVGSLYQNAGLYCASAGLANVVRLNGVAPLNKVIPLPQGYEVFIVQAVGLPR